MKNPRSKPRRRAAAFAALALAVLGAVGYALWKEPRILAAIGIKASPAALSAAEAAAGVAGGDEAGAAASKAAGGARVVAAKAETLAASIESTGNLEPTRALDLSFRSPGVVKSIEVSAGQRVAEGAALASLDDRDARYKLADAELRLQTARVSGNQKQAELIALERDMRAADLEETILRAPFAGVVSSVDVDVGASVAASTKALRLLDRASLKAVLEIDEIDLPAIKLGQRVDFAFDAFPGKKYSGRVTLIPQEGKVTNQGLAVFPVEATLSSPPAELRPGYSFVATIAPFQPKAAVVIPSAALAERNGSFYVLVWKGLGLEPERRKVAATRRDDGNAEVTEGLAADEKVVVAPAAAQGQGRGGFGLGIPGLGGPPPGGGDHNNAGSRNAGGGAGGAARVQGGGGGARP